jgi:hypothetical protein
MELELNKFDPRILEKKRIDGHAPTMVFISARNSGKSTLVADILWHMKAIPVVFCMSGTEKANSFYGKHIHELCIYDNFEPEVLNGIVEKQKNVVKEIAKSGKNPKGFPEKGVGVVFDDLAYDKSMMKEPSMREIFFNGRHYLITTIITFQYMMDMRPEFRTNIDYVFVSKENKKDNIDKLYKYFFGMFDKVADFKRVLSACTNDYGCLVLDNTSRSDRIQDSVFWYKAKVGHEFKIAEKMWPIWDRQVKKDEEEEEKEFAKPRQKSDIIVKKKGPKPVNDDYED